MRWWRSWTLRRQDGRGVGGRRPVLPWGAAQRTLQCKLKTSWGCHQDLEFGVAKDEDKCSSGLRFSVFPSCPLIMRSQRVVLGASWTPSMNIYMTVTPRQWLLTLIMKINFLTFEQISKLFQYLGMFAVEILIVVSWIKIEDSTPDRIVRKYRNSILQ